MTYFDKDFLDFLKDLAAHNDRDWFKANKKRYEKSVKEPFARFVADLITEVAKKDPLLNIEPKQAIFRIHRDVRFSKDKRPYKSNVSAVVAPGGRKEMTLPGLYIQLDPEHTRIYSGVYMPDKERLEDIRYAIANDMKGFQKLISDKKFKDHFGEIRGEKYKRLPKDWADLAEEQPLLFNKQFYYYAFLPPETALSKDLMKTVMEYYEAGQGLRDFFRKSFGVQ
jgi:uncharacterized protein (TIGR02453 family)